MTIVRYQIHCLVSKNDAVIIVIDCVHVHHVSVNHFFILSAVLQCHVVRSHSFNVEVTVGNCGAKWADMSKTSRIDHVLLSLIGTRLIFPIHRVPTLLTSSENIQSPSPAHRIVFT